MSKADVLGVFNQLAGFYDSLPFEWLLVGHCLLVSSWFTRLKDRFLLCYWVGLLAAFGGGVVSALLLQDPAKAPIALFADNKVGVIWTTCWWLITFFPYNLVERTHQLLPVRLVTKASLNILRAGVMASRIDLVVAKFPGVVAAPLVVGTIAASGGKFTIDGVLAVCGELTGAPGEAVVPGFAFRSGFLGSVIYYGAVYVLGSLSRAEAKALIITLFVAHGVFADIVGQPLDYTSNCHKPPLNHTAVVCGD
ncbi:hypothetical protein WJX72_011360 [[Myrmecia] bisecta]|uniref:Uncharacterized protein n=1 Tax=[Myrmecia] bisecta TaxID=41462 RepID=A0AAW1P7E9_9CHLO